MNETLATTAADVEEAYARGMEHGRRDREPILTEAARKIEDLTSQSPTAEEKDLVHRLRLEAGGLRLEVDDDREATRETFGLDWIRDSCDTMAVALSTMMKDEKDEDSYYGMEAAHDLLGEARGCVRIVLRRRESTPDDRDRRETAREILEKADEMRPDHDGPRFEQSYPPCERADKPFAGYRCWDSTIDSAEWCDACRTSGPTWDKEQAPSWRPIVEGDVIREGDSVRSTRLQWKPRTLSVSAAAAWSLLRQDELDGWEIDR